MVGYHYTSAENYEKIKVKGLLPYWIKKRELESWFPSGIHGIWIWKHDLSGNDHVGSILWQLMTKSSTTIVKLRVEYDESQRFCFHGIPVEIDHDGRLGEWVYHDRIPAIVLVEPVPPERIALVGTYDLEKRLSAP
jgi:hypothetical protein